VPAGQGERVLAEFRGACNLSFAWCRALVQQAAQGRGVPESGDVWHRGACHCGNVQFEARAPTSREVVRCNCSICDKTGFLHLLVQAERFRLRADDGLLTTYQFNTRVAKHTFCRESWDLDERGVKRSAVQRVKRFFELTCAKRMPLWYASRSSPWQWCAS
jgi:hypothetical protein